MCQDCQIWFPPRFQVILSTEWIQNPFVYKMNLGVNCLSIRSAKPNDPLLNTDKNVQGCVHADMHSCAPRFVVRVQMSQSKSLAGNSIWSTPGLGMVWVSQSCWEHCEELSGVEMQSTGAGELSILFLAGIQILSLWALILVLLGMVQHTRDAAVFLPGGSVSQIDVADEEQGEDVLYSDHAGWELRLNEMNSLVWSPMGKHLLQTMNWFESCWPHKPSSPSGQTQIKEAHHELCAHKRWKLHLDPDFKHIWAHLKPTDGFHFIFAVLFFLSFEDTLC